MLLTDPPYFSSVSQFGTADDGYQDKNAHRDPDHGIWCQVYFLSRHCKNLHASLRALIILSLAAEAKGLKRKNSKPNPVIRILRRAFLI